MLISEQIKYFQGGVLPAQRNPDDLSGRRVEDPLADGIPTRYRDGHGGINLERVKRDQRMARNEFVRAMLQRMRNLF